MGHTAWAQGRKGQSQRGPKGGKLEVGARRAPKLLVYIYNIYDIYKLIKVVSVAKEYVVLTNCKEEVGGNDNRLFTGENYCRWSDPPDA